MLRRPRHQEAIHLALVTASALTLIAGEGSAAEAAPPALAPTLAPALDRGALVGSLTGAVVGGALYCLVAQGAEPGPLMLWSAGGGVVGAGVTLAERLLEDSRVRERLWGRNSSSAPSLTFVLPVLRARF